MDTLVTTPLLPTEGSPTPYHSTATTDSSADNNPHEFADDKSSTSSGLASSSSEHHLTTVPETFLHLVKGYIGPGMLSLPWAVSQLGIPVGFLAVFVMSYWSSYNCWTVVRVKRYIERSRGVSNNNNTEEADDEVSETASSVTTNTNITYPDVGEWAYGKTFQAYVSACICTQQLAICTVFISFIGENLMAVLQAMTSGGSNSFWESHTGVMTACLPACLCLSFIPSLKGLAPIMAAGTVLLLATLFIMAIIGEEEWHDKPTEYPTFAFSRSPLALCAILYSYEGICLILPIESAMEEPKKFGKTFAGAMALVSLILATFSCSCVFVFGEVTNGSVTAFLMRHYDNVGDQVHLTALLLAANTAISFSVLLTYPIQLYPAVELLGPSWSKFFGTHIVALDVNKETNEEENDLTGFDPLPPLPEHDTFAEEEEFDQPMHTYDEENDKDGGKDSDDDKDTAQDTKTGLTIDNVLTRGGSSVGGADIEDNQSIGSFLSSAISFPNQMMPKMVLPGDSPQLRASLVLLTYSIAVVVPNVQALISLAGALAGSSSALLIPPVLELAWLDHLESGTSSPSATTTTTGGPPLSPSMLALKKKTEGITTANANNNHNKSPRLRKYLWPRLKNYALLGAGFVFMIIGTSASLADIVAIYAGK